MMLPWNEYLKFKNYFYYSIPISFWTNIYVKCLFTLEHHFLFTAALIGVSRKHDFLARYFEFNGNIDLVSEWS